MLFRTRRKLGGRSGKGGVAFLDPTMGLCDDRCLRFVSVLCYEVPREVCARMNCLSTWPMPPGLKGRTQVRAAMHLWNGTVINDPSVSGCHPPEGGRAASAQRRHLPSSPETQQGDCRIHELKLVFQTRAICLLSLRNAIRGYFEGIYYRDYHPEIRSKTNQKNC